MVGVMTYLDRFTFRTSRLRNSVPDGLMADRRGVAAVEAAFFFSGFTLIVLILAQFYIVISTQERMREALRAAAQYVINGGTTLARVQTIFEQAYGTDAATFESELVCICPLSVETFESASDDTSSGDTSAGDTDSGSGSGGATSDFRTSQGYGERATRVALTQREGGGWPQCSATCDDGEPAQSFASFGASDRLAGVLIDGYKDIEADIAVRLIQ